MPALARIPDPAQQADLSARLSAAGPTALDDLEALQLLAGLSEAQAAALISEFGSLPEIFGADRAALCCKVPADAADRLALEADLARRLLAAPLAQRCVLGSWSAVVDYLRIVLGGRGREEFRVLFLDKRNRLIRDEVLGHGTVDHEHRKMLPLSRRGLIAASGGAAALLIGVQVTRSGRAAGAKFEPDGFIRIDREGAVTLIMPQVEMGQGTYTSISMILAEELDAAWDKVRVEHAPPNEKLYANPMLGIQATGNSNSIRAFWTPLRKAGAGGRAVLIEAAASRWGVPAKECGAQDSQVIHQKSARRIGYGDLVSDAAQIAPPKDPPLKDPKAFKLIGRPIKRLDTPDKVNGRVVYGIDALPPGVKFATLAQSPVRGGKVVRVDDTKAKAVPGVRQIVVLDDVVAVVGDHMWAAKSGLEALAITWDEGPNGQVSSEQIWSRLRKASEREGAVAKSAGDADKALSAGDAVTMAYEEPLLAHAALEPLNCTVHVTPGGVEVWTGTQVMARVQHAAAEATSTPVEKVTVHNHLLGGGFGRRLEPDMAFVAARIAKRVDGPVKVVWTRDREAIRVRQTVGEDVETELVCGRLHLESATDDMLLRLLPHVIVLPLAGQRASAGLVDTIREELGLDRAGAAAIARDLASALFIILLRAHLEAEPPAEGLLALLGHRETARAAEAMLKEPAKTWSLDELASIAAVSRATLVRAFRRIGGATPQAFLTEVRLGIARNRIEQTSDALGRIAAEVGYQSDAALSRALQRRFTVRPGAMRQASQAQQRQS